MKCTVFKRMISLLFAVIAVISCCAGCALLPLSNFGVIATAPNCEEFEIYKTLRSEIQDDSTLPDRLDAFEKMCAIPMETTCDLYLLEVYTSDFEGKKTVHFKVSYQFEIRSYYEMLEVGFYTTYNFEEDLAGFDEIKFIEDDWEEFVSYVRGREIFKRLSQRQIIDSNVFAVSW